MDSILAERTLKVPHTRCINFSSVSSVKLPANLFNTETVTFNDFRFSKLTLLYCPFFHKNCSPNCEWFHFSSFPWLHTPTFMISMIVEIFPKLVQVLLFCWFFPKVLFRFVLEVSLFVRDPLVCLLCLCYSQPERFIWYFF